MKKKLKEVQRAVENGEMTTMERHLMKKIKVEKARADRAEAERDVMKGLLLAAGLKESILDEVLEHAHS